MGQAASTAKAAIGASQLDQNKQLDDTMNGLRTMAEDKTSEWYTNIE